MKICVLVCYEQDECSSAFIDNLSGLLPQAEFSLAVIKKETAQQQICDLIEHNNYDLFFNFCDGSDFSAEAGIEVVITLESKAVAFTGADSHFYDPTRLAMKMAAQSVGVQTPRYFFIENHQYDILEITKTLNFPMIVKPPQGANSFGIFKASLVKDIAALSARISKTFSKYGGVLIEEFIAGREYTVLVLENPHGKEPYVFQALECVLRGPMDFKYYNLKWKEYDLMRWLPCQDKALNDRLMDATKKVFVALKGNGFARADIRVDNEGNIFLLELNPNCSIYGWSPDTYGSADLILLQTNAHPFFTETLIELALARANTNRQKQKLDVECLN